VVATATSLRMYQHVPRSTKPGGNVGRQMGTRDGDKGVPSSVVSAPRGGLAPCQTTAYHQLSHKGQNIWKVFSPPGILLDLGHLLCFVLLTQVILKLG